MFISVAINSCIVHFATIKFLFIFIIYLHLYTRAVKMQSSINAEVLKLAISQW